ncbi:MAG TPA: DMT family transporter [Anaerolineae bacterium]|nr:DMT family transporter [Anaerolineae bacterium]
MPRDRLIAIAECITVLIFMSLGTVLMKLALSNVSPWTFVALTVLVGMICLSIYTFVIRGERIPRGLSRQVWFYIIAIGLCNFAIARLTSTLALQRMPATTSTYVTNFIGFITMGMSIFILKETPTVFQALGAVVAIIGLRIFFVEIPSAYELVGIGLIFIGITAVAFTNNIARKLAIVTRNELSNNIVSTVAILIGGSISVVVGLAADFPPRVDGLNNWLIILYSGIVITAIGLTVWNQILRTLRSYEASILGASTVIWTALLAVPILGERLTVNQVIGILLMIIGLALVQIRRGRFSALLRRKSVQVTSE